jgi:hypothetical protein
MGFDDLTDPARQFIIAILEELEREEHTTKGRFKAVWQLLDKRWALTASGRPLELSVAVDTGTLDELEKLGYVVYVPDGIVRVYSILQKSYDQYELHLKPPPTISIFLNYREEDTLYHMGPLDYRLKMEFGPDRVFFAKRGIDLGDAWRATIRDAIGSCRVMLVLIGPRWLTVTGEKGGRRLDDPEDIVRWEIETALDQEKRVIPVLLEGASVPRKQDLPDSLKVLPDLQAHRINGYDWEPDTTRLVDDLKAALR